MEEHEHVDEYSLTTVADNMVGGGYNAVSTTAAQVIYGRNEEALALLQSYQQLLVTNRAQTVIVHGESGSGKTFLVDSTFRGLVCDDEQ